jgi:hypothetical protein
MPLDPPVRTDNWDALLDSLVSGIAETSDEAFAIIWLGSRSMADTDPRGYQDARGVLTAAVTSVSRLPMRRVLSVFLA